MERQVAEPHDKPLNPQPENPAKTSPRRYAPRVPRPKTRNTPSVNSTPSHTATTTTSQGITVRYAVNFKATPRVRIRTEPPPPKPPQCADVIPKPGRLARMLALAHHIERLVESGQIKDYAEAARNLGITRARVTQVMNLLHLSPRIQAAILIGEAAFSERALRPLLASAQWKQQQELLP